MSAAYAILTKNRCAFGGRAGTSLMVCSQTPVSTVTPEAGLAGQLFCKGGDKVMKKAVRKGASKAAALVLSLAMIFGMVPLVGASAEETAGAQDNFDRIVHLDMGRKYFTPEWIKALIKESAALGYTALELDFSNNEGFRFSLPEEQMKIEVGGYETVLVEVEPEEPAAPVEPTEPAAPVESAEPVELTEPAAPVESTEPVEPTEPAAPVEPTEPTESAPQYKEVQVWNSKTVDLTAALSSDGYITADQMEDIIACADEAGIEIIPLLNSPGHMGAILDVFPEYRWTAKNGKTSESTIDLRNEEAVKFAQGVVSAYAKWFAEQDCTTFNIGADEFANDIGDSVGDIMGLDYIYKNDRDLYGALIDYIDDLAVFVEGCGMTPRAFNDSFCYSNDTSDAPSRNIQVCYWSSGWNGYSPASASTLADEGYELINTHGNYYYILGKDDCWDRGAGYDFNNNAFAGGSTISDPAGAMFCIWCDDPIAETEQQVAEKIRLPLRVMAARMQGEDVSAGSVDMTVIPGGFNADGTINTDAPSTEVKDEATGVAVTAPGLTGIAVEKADAPALAEVPYVAYNVTLNGGGYTGSAEVTIPLAGTGLENAEALMGFVLEQDGSVTPVEGQRSGADFTFTAPHFSTVGVYDASALAASSVAGDYEQFTGTMEEGRYLIVYEYTHREGSWPNYHNVTDYYTLGSDGLASLVERDENGVITLDENDGNLLWNFERSGNGWAITNSEGHRMGMSGSKGWFGSWTITPDYNDSNPCVFTVSSSGNGWNISAGVTDGGDNTTGYLVGTADRWGDVSFSGDTDQGTLYLYKLAEPTYAVTIICQTEDGVEIQKVQEMWPAGAAVIEAPSISGYDVVPPSEQTIAVTPSGLNTVTFTYKQSENPPSNALRGNSLEVEWWITNSMVREEANDWADSSTTISSSDANSNDGVALTGVSPETAYSNYDGWVELHYWQSMRLDRDNHQTGDSGDDETADGTVITRVRYHNGAWQYMDENGLWNWFVSGDQVVTYYMRHTDITKEITTAMKDWGYDPNTSGGTSDTSGGDGQVALSVAVVYPDGSLSPAEGDIYLNSTTIFNYWAGRDIGIIAPLNNSEYTVTRITVVDGERDDRGWWDDRNTNVWYGDDTITWNKENGRFVEREVWSEDMGGAPMVNGKVSNITWPAKSTAKLVLIYLEPVKRESNLKVEYRVDDASKTLLYGFDVVVSETAEEPVTFLNSLVNGSDQPPYQPGEIDLSDDAYIVNSSNVHQTFNKNLATIPDLNLPARYNYVRAEISEDGKTLTLYYNRLASQYQFVVDYGLPVEIDFAALSIEANGLQSVSGGTADMSVAADLASQTLTVTPKGILNDTATVPLTLTYKDTSGGTNTQEVTVDFIPASTVYYEDTEPFVDYSGNWSLVGDADTDRAQTTSKLGDKAIYGYDAAYGTDATYSGGSAHKVTLSSGQTATATFSFHGTGFQLVSMTDATSGCITVHVEGNGVDKYYFVDNYYASGTLYQVPVMKVDDLELGNYTVTVTACYLNSRNWDSDEAGTSTFVLDGIRIYKPIGDYADYAQDNEGGAVYSEIRNTLIGGWQDTNKVYVDTLGESTNELGKYLKVGPNNEVYLKENDQITFTVPEGGSIVQIGAKLVSGGRMTFSVTGTDINDSETISTATATEMYYLLDGVQPGNTITITAAGDGILSLTNLKLVSGS